MIKKKIKIIPVQMSKNKFAYTYGSNKIYVNKELLNSGEVPQRKKVEVLLHEMMHILQKSNKFLIFKNFKTINELGKKLKVIIKKYTKDPAYFLIGKDHKLLGSRSFPPQEIIAYLMSDSIEWKGMKDPGKQLFVKELKDSGIFNLKSKFWRERLS